MAETVDKRESTEKENTHLEDDTEAFQTTDPLSYTPQVLKVLSHNRSIAEQDGTQNSQLTSPASSSVEPQRPINFTVVWKDSSWLAGASGGPNDLKICPSVNKVGTYWHLIYSTKEHATLKCCSAKQTENLSEKAVGEIATATFDWSDGSDEPIIEPHDTWTTKTDYRMSCSKDTFGSPRYSIKLPSNVGKMTVMWVFGHVDGYADGRLLGDQSKEREVALKETLRKENEEPHLQSPGTAPPVTDSSSETAAKKDPWQLYATRFLTDSSTGRILATYTRSAPWSKTAGTLTIFPKLLVIDPEQYETLSAEVIEAVVIVTAALVGIEQRRGILTALKEAGAESMRWLEQAPHPLHSDP